MLCRGRVSVHTACSFRLQVRERESWKGVDGGGCKLSNKFEVFYNKWPIMYNIHFMDCQFLCGVHCPSSKVGNDIFAYVCVCVLFSSKKISWTTAQICIKTYRKYRTCIYYFLPLVTTLARYIHWHEGQSWRSSTPICSETTSESYSRGGLGSSFLLYMCHSLPGVRWSASGVLF